MENSLKLIKQIESTHKGLGIPVLFGNIACLAKISVMYIGEVGMGKSTLISSIYPFDVDKKFDLTFDAVTMQEMADRIGIASNKNMLWRMKEWGTLTDHHRKLFLTIGAKIITDHEYYHEMGSVKGIPIVIDLKNVNLTAMIGITPLKFARMIQENENWASLASDRFIKFILYNPTRKDTITEAPHFDIYGEYHFTEIPIETSLMLIQNLLRKQVSENRLITYCRALVRAYAIFEGRNTVTAQEELEFDELFRPYLEGYGNFVYAADIEDEPHFAIGGLRLFSVIARHEGITLDELKDSFFVYEKAYLKRKSNNERYQINYEEMIKRHAQILIDRDMVKMTHNSPDKFYLSDKYKSYFNQFEGLTN